MGAWSPAIFDDDLAADLRAEYEELMEAGMAPAEAVAQLVQNHPECLEDEDDGPVFWLALAALQVELGHLLQPVRQRALKVIEHGANLRRWEADATPAEAAERRRVLQHLRSQLQVVH